VEVKFVRKTNSLEIYGKELNDLDKEVINFGFVEFLYFYDSRRY